MGTWFWLNIPLELLFFCCWAGIPLWLTLTRWRAELGVKHAELAAVTAPAPAFAQPDRAAAHQAASPAYAGVADAQPFPVPLRNPSEPGGGSATLIAAGPRRQPGIGPRSPATFREPAPHERNGPAMSHPDRTEHRVQRPEELVSWTGRERLRFLWYRLCLTISEMNYASQRMVELQMRLPSKWPTVPQGRAQRPVRRRVSPVTRHPLPGRGVIQAPDRLDD